MTTAAAAQAVFLPPTVLPSVWLARHDVVDLTVEAVGWHIAPMNHRVRFNLAYVVQELAQRSLNDTLKSVSSEGRVARVEKALENIQVALHMFTQLKELGNQPKFGFDTKRTTVHANFCKQALEKSKPHVEKAHAEEQADSESKARSDERADSEAPAELRGHRRADDRP